MSTPLEGLHKPFADAAGKHALLMPFFVCGYPDPETFVDLCVAAQENGASVLEVGLPFSDPVMDGPVIADATHEVLARGFRVDDALRLLDQVRQRCSIPIVAMTYTNLAFQRGYDRFAAQLVGAGVNGIILPDLSVEDAQPHLDACTSHALATVFIASQTSPPPRVAALAAASTGFVYAASLLGVTGVRQDLNVNAKDLVATIREATDLPVAVGIGVSTPEHAAEVATYADGVIVGSALVRAVGESDSPVEAAASLLRSLSAAIR
jgi:tryptophan synthase alpha chain